MFVFCGMSALYILKEGFNGIRRARLAAFTSITALTLAVFVIGVLARIGWNAYEVAQSLRSEIKMEVFLTDADREAHRVIGRGLLALPIIAEADYISKDSASAIFRREFGAEGTPLTELDFLPASYRLTLKTDITADSVAGFLPTIRATRGVDDVSINMDLLLMIENRLDTLAKTGGGIGLLILFVAVILVFNTIRLTIYAKKNIIRAMKLVGATNGFIRSPFLMEGLFQGLIASAIAMIGVWILFEKLMPDYIHMVLEWPMGRWYYLTGGMVALALSMGFFGSHWAARTFIKNVTVGRS